MPPPTARMRSSRSTPPRPPRPATPSPSACGARRSSHCGSCCQNWQTAGDFHRTRAAGKLKFPSERVEAVGHVGHSAALFGRRRIEANAVVLNLEGHDPVALAESDLRLGGLRVLLDVLHPSQAAEIPRRFHLLRTSPDSL